MAEQQSTVATPDARAAEMEQTWAIVRALLGGTAAMRKAGQALLPKWPKEDRESYAQRLAVAVLFPAYQRSVTTLAGKPFSKPVSIGDDVPARLRGWLDDIDLEGRNLHAFASDCMEQALGYGLGGILVDYPDATAAPATAAGVRTEADERRADRPSGDCVGPAGKHCANADRAPSKLGHHPSPPSLLLLVLPASVPAPSLVTRPNPASLRLTPE